MNDLRMVEALTKAKALIEKPYGVVTLMPAYEALSDLVAALKDTEVGWNLEAAADQLAEISQLKDAPRDWLLAEARAVVEAAFTCPHDDAGDGDWCYLCWTNIKTGETWEEFQKRDVGPMG